jgi:hypothetical protein
LQCGSLRITNAPNLIVYMFSMMAAPPRFSTIVINAGRRGNWSDPAPAAMNRDVLIDSYWRNREMYRYMHTARTVSSSTSASVRPARRVASERVSASYQLDYLTWQQRLRGDTGMTAPMVYQAVEPVSLPAASTIERSAA